MIALPYVVVSCGVILMHRRVLDVMAVGDVEAASLGVDPARVRLVLVLTATLGTAAVVSVSGLIGFVGIVVPHAVRLLFGAAHHTLLPLALLLRRGVPGARRRRRPHRAGAGRGADRGRDRAGRRAVLPGRAAAAQGGAVTSAVAGAWSAGACTSTAAASRVVTDVDLVVEPGDWVAVVGPNGAGKTSLLHAVAGLIPATGRRCGSAASTRRTRRVGGWRGWWR